MAEAPNESEIGGEVHRYSRDATVAVMSELTRALPALNAAPTLLVVADDSYLPSHVWADELRSQIESIEVVHVPGGHDVLVDAFEQTADAVERFLT